MNAFFAPDMDIAKSYGIDEAFIICNLEMVLSGYQTKIENPFRLEGQIWGVMSVEELVGFFPYMENQQVINALNHLIEEEIILHRIYDEKDYYTFTDKGWGLVR